jgi:O-methyltransferase
VPGTRIVVDRRDLDRRIRSVTAPGPHRWWHIDAFVDAVLDSPVCGVLVECGSYQGSSTAKLSHLADALGRELVVFDSFQGLPVNNEQHTVTINGKDITGIFGGGAFAGTLEQVRTTVECHGVPSAVRYVPGWFADTLPGFVEPVAAAYLDCDLAASTRTCLDSLWPLVSPGGCIVSQDGEFPLVIDAMRDWLNWADPAPTIVGLGESKMVTFRKPAVGEVY